MTKARELSELGSYLNVSGGIASVNNITVSSNLEINVVVANGSVGTAGQMLTSNGSGVYWLTPQIGDITNVIAGTGLTGGGSSGEVTVSLATSGVVANTYGNSSSIPVITVDTYGRLTNVSTTAVAGVTNFTYTGANNTFSISTGDGSTFTASIIAANATLAGVVTVLDSVTNTSVLIAASANSVKNAYDRAIDANTRAASAQTAAISAYSNATSYADSAAATAYSNAVSVASTDATNKAANAYSNAVSYAATIAGTAYSNAVSTAAADATSKANNAYTTAVAAAASDATSKSNNAYTTAVSAASTDATNKAANAYSNATTFASNASNISSGTLAEARLPFRMNQNVRTTDTVQFGNMTVTGNLTVSGTTVTVSANNLVLQDNMIYLNDGNTVANPDLGIAGNYNDGTYRHAGFFRDATDGVWKVYDQYLPEPDASPYIDTSNTSFRIADFQANAVTMGSATVSGSVGIGNTSPSQKLTVQGAQLTIPTSGWSTSQTAYNYLGDTNNGIASTFGSPTNVFGFHGVTFSAQGTELGRFDTTGVGYATASFRAPIFYDSNDTTYYVDPASTSNMSQASFRDYIRITNSGGAQHLLMGNQDSGGTNSPAILTSANRYFEFGYGNTWTGDGGTKTYYSYMGSDFARHNASYRAPIFYDTDNTAYFLDAASGSTSLFTAGLLRTYGWVQAGYLTGGVAMTTNDGYGNANITWNHIGGTPEQNGNSGRIVVNTDATSGVYMDFQVKSNVTSGVAVGLTSALTAYETYTEIKNSTRSPIYYDSNNTAYWVDPASNSVLTSFNLGGGETYVYSGATNALNVRTGAGGSYKYFGFEAGGRFVVSNGGIFSGGYLDIQYNSGNEYAGMGIRNNYGSASLQATGFIDFINENGFQKASLFGVIATDGHGYLQFLSTAPGVSRSADSRTTTAYAYHNQWSFQTSAGIATNILYDRDNSTYYLDPSSSTVIENLAIKGSVYSVFDSAQYYDAAIEVRERNLGGAQADSFNNAPRLGFHWGGRVAMQLALDSGSVLNVMNGDCTGWTAFRAGDMYGNAFYDRGDTSYYVDPTSTSVLNNLNVLNDIYITRTTNEYGFIVRPNSAGYKKLQFAVVGGGALEEVVANATTLRSTGDVRGSIFYDTNNTAYYTDPASTSVLNALSVGGSPVMRGVGQAGATGIDWNTLGNNQNTTYEITQETFNLGTGSGNSNFPTTASYKYGTLVNFGANSSARAQMYISHAGNDLIFRGGWTDSSWQTWNKVLTDQNYTSYAMPAGASATNSVDVRAPIFYDSNNTAYYIDGNGTSILAALRVNYPAAGYVLQDYGWLVAQDSSARGISIGYDPSADRTWMYSRHVGVAGKPISLNDILVVGAGGGFTTSAGSMRAPIFYDNDNTGYYVNPNGTSVLYNMELINLRCGFDRSWDNYPGIAVRNTTDQGPQGEFRIHGLGGANGGDFAVTLRVDGAGVFYGDFYAPIFYDFNNSAYYCDPNSTSNMYRISVAEKFYAQGGTGVNECCGSDATISVGGSSARPPSISWHYSGVMQGNMQGNQTGWRKIYFYDDQGNGLGVHATGQIASNADVIAYYSDKRLKKDLARVVDHWNVINNLTGYRFTWNEKSGEIPGFQDKVGKREVGLIAQDVQAVYPEAIAMRTEGPEDDPYMTIKHDRFTAVFIEALKDLRRELDEVKEENKKLREMINGQ